MAPGFLSRAPPPPRGLTSIAVPIQFLVFFPSAVNGLYPSRCPGSSEFKTRRMINYSEFCTPTLRKVSISAALK